MKEIFDKLISEMNLPPCDLLIIGDGSGTTRDEPCGWYCKAYSPYFGWMRDFFGCSNTGTNNYAELFPYIQALWHYETIKLTLGITFTKVIIISDSEVTVRCGNGSYNRNCNLSLWAAIDWFVQHGYQIVWKHVPRNSNPVNKLADEMSKKMRHMLAAKSEAG